MRIACMCVCVYKHTDTYTGTDGYTYENINVNIYIYTYVQTHIWFKLCQQLRDLQLLVFASLSNKHKQQTQISHPSGALLHGSMAKDLSGRTHPVHKNGVADKGYWDTYFWLLTYYLGNCSPTGSSSQ